MRYYDLKLFSQRGHLLTLSDLGLSFKQGLSFNAKVPAALSDSTFSSQLRAPDGSMVNNPGALNIEFDVVSVGYALPQGGSSICISGIGLKCIGQAANLNSNPATGKPPAKFILAAGLSKGLPLANDYVNRKLGGIIAQGQVFSAYGNWQSTEQTLDLIVQPAATTIADGGDSPNGFNGIAFIWLPGQNLQDALTDSLSVAFPDLQSPSISILGSFIQSASSQPIVGWYDSLSQFADYILQLTIPLGTSLTGNKYYPGVIVGIQAGRPFALDGTQNPKTVTLAFQDLVGQPTWIAPNQISFKTVLRADIQLGDFVQMPPDPGTGGTSIISALALTQQGAAVPGAPARNSSVFKGSFFVNEVHHFANSRQPDADSWATGFRAVATG